MSRSISARTGGFYIMQRGAASAHSCAPTTRRAGQSIALYSIEVSE